MEKVEAIDVHSRWKTVWTSKNGRWAIDQEIAVWSLADGSDTEEHVDAFEFYRLNPDYPGWNAYGEAEPRFLQTEASAAPKYVNEALRKLRDKICSTT